MRQTIQTIVIVLISQIILVAIGFVTGVLYLPFAPMDDMSPAFPGAPVEAGPPGAEFAAPAGIEEDTVAILPGNSFESTLSAAGRIELQSTDDIIFQVGGDIHQIAVAVGDLVTAGDLLATLDTTALERTVAKAQIDLETVQVELKKLVAEIGETEVAEAAAELLASQENLAKSKRGPTAEELAAAESNAAAGWAKYNELVAPASADKIAEAKATLMKAEIDLQAAQRAYNEVAWLPEVGASAEAAELQKATIEYERVKAVFDQANQPTSRSEIQAALSTAQKAQDELNQLREKPLPSEVAEAEAKVAGAEAKLRKLQNGAAPADIQAAELKIRRALIDLEEAESALRSAKLMAPISGTVLELKVKAGEQVSAGTVALVIGDTSKLKLTINVAEVDIRKIQVDQAATITLDAIRGQSLTGNVIHIAPISKDDQNVVNYPVTIGLTSSDLAEVRAGMTALATFAQDTVADATWLVPTSALEQRGGKTVVTVVRDAGQEEVAVETGSAQGEWTYVRSPELTEGDQVVGQIASYVDEQAAFFGE